MERNCNYNGKRYYYLYDPKYGDFYLNVYNYNEDGIIDEIIFSRGQDYGFKAWDFKDDNVYNPSKEVQEFTFTSDDLVFFPLLHLLNGEEKLIIEDDFTLDYRVRYMVIKKDGNDIKIEFHDTKDAPDKFSVCIKNFMYDGRSKIDQQGLDTKERLHNFFMEIHNEFMKSYHQITIEEYTYKKVLK